MNEYLPEQPYNELLNTIRYPDHGKSATLSQFLSCSHIGFLLRGGL